MSVDVHTNEKVVAVDERGVRSASGAFYPADLVVWAAGIRAPAWLAELDGLEVNRVEPARREAHAADDARPGRVRARRLRRVPVAGRKATRTRPSRRARRRRIQQAKLLVRTVRARLDGRPLPEFRFRDYGSLVSLGELSAVGTLMGNLIGGSMLVQGLIARAMYASLYKLHQRALFGTRCRRARHDRTVPARPRRAARQAALIAGRRDHAMIAQSDGLLQCRSTNADEDARDRACLARAAAPGLDPAPLATIRVLVWDLPVRFVHWAIVALLVGLIITGKLGADWLIWHMRFGQAMLALVVFRVIWGFVGSRNARFSAFLLSALGGSSATHGRCAGEHEVHATHNPAGGWMVVALLVALLVQATTGLFTNDDILWGGPLVRAGDARKRRTRFSSVHRQFWWVIVALSVLHIGAVLAYLVLLKDNLIVPMFTGYKQLPRELAKPDDAAASTIKAIVLLALCGFAVWYAFERV